MEWKTIDSAPRDGSRILLYRPTARYGFNVVFGTYDDNRFAKKPRPYWKHDWENIGGVAESRENQPTHWAPIPPPPAKE